MFQSLAFVEPGNVVAAFTAMMISLDNETDAVLEDFLVYFETTWIGVMQRGRRRRPLFGHSIWNVNERVVEDLPRTNNSIEKMAPCVCQARRSHPSDNSTLSGQNH